MNASSALHVLARVGLATVVPAVAAAGVVLGSQAASAAPASSAVTSQVVASQASTVAPSWAQAQWRLRGWYADPVGCSASGQAYVRGGVISYRCVFLPSPPYKMLPWELDLLY